METQTQHKGAGWGWTVDTVLVIMEQVGEGVGVGELAQVHRDFSKTLKQLFFSKPNLSSFETKYYKYFCVTIISCHLRIACHVLIQLTVLTSDIT